MRAKSVFVRGITFSNGVVVMRPIRTDYCVSKSVDRTTAIQSPVMSTNPNPASACLEEGRVLDL